jgi:hypothetical protein
MKWGSLPFAELRVGIKKLAPDLTSYLTMHLEGRLVYRVSDFAEKAGVTVRTLHHYDRMGLLKPH